MFVVFALAVMPLMADMPAEYRIMSHFEWGWSRLPFLSGMAVVLFIYFAIVAFITAFTVSVRKKKSAVTAWMAACSPALWSLLILFNEANDSLVLSFFSILAVAVVAWIVSMFLLLRARKYLKALLFTVLQLAMFVLFFAVVIYVAPSDSIETTVIRGKEGESYEDYRKRAIRIRDHLCPECDAPMKSAYYLGVHWFCEKCGHGKKEYEEAVKRK